MTNQETVDQLIRIHIGDLMVQIVMLKARIAELEAAPPAEEKPEVIVNKPNGRHEKRVEDG